MKQLQRPFRSLALAALAASATFVAAPAAKAAAEGGVGKITFDDLPSPEFQAGGKAKAFKPKDWLEVEAELTLQGTPEQKKVGFIDLVLVKWYVAVKNPEGKGSIKLTKDITYVNVPCGGPEPTYVSAYLAPSTIKRLTGQDKAGKSSVDVVGIEVLVGGVKVGAATTKMKEGWWTAPSLSDQSAKFPLLNKDETPFSVLWFDRYPEIQKQR